MYSQGDRTVMERWWVIFTDRNHGGLLHAFTSKGFRHCFALKEIHSGQLLFMEPARERLVVVAAGGWAYEWLKAFSDSGARIVVVERTFPLYPVISHETPKVGPLLTCAAVIAYELGIEGWVVTPKQLYRRLLRDHGGEEIMV